VVLALVGVIGIREAMKVNAANKSHSADYRASWSAGSAANYLDQREVWWQSWPPAQIDHKTVCISCHTVVPYAMIRTDLGRQLREAAQPEPEKLMMASVEKRVTNWGKMTPFYSDAVNGPGKTAESHATEAVLNAVILISYDIQTGQLRQVTRMAIDEAWALQEKSGVDAGGWKWQNFQLAPWESTESPYQGAALFLLEIEMAPDGYAGEPQAQENLTLLKQYLRRQYAAQPFVNKLHILWLSAKVPDILSPADKSNLLQTIQREQRPDGGWSLASLDPRSATEGDRWRRLSAEIKEMVKSDPSDGYATGLVVLVLKSLGTDARNASMQRGVEWLKHHQENDGSWWAQSLNGKSDPQSDVGRFMRDAATAYAVMALEDRPSQLAGK
jgi:hypothetical protein